MVIEGPVPQGGGGGGGGGMMGTKNRSRSNTRSELQIKLSPIKSGNVNNSMVIANQDT